MMWDLPITVEIDGTKYAIRNKCDYRVVLDVIATLNDKELDEENRIRCALFIFYEDLIDCRDIETAIKEMMKIINNGEEETEQSNKPQIMDWQHDFKNLAPPISRTLGYDIRIPDKYTHWWSFLGGYMEIGDCTFANIVSIRNKRQKGKKLEEWELEFYKENRKMVDLPQNLTAEEQAWLDAEW